MFGRDTIAAFLEWTQGAGLWGALVFGFAYIPAAVLFVPASVLTLGAGFAFGVVKGTIIVSFGSTAGATAAFMVARTAGQEWAAGRMARYPALEAIGRAVESEAFKVVILTRLSPLFPFNMLNYTFGLSSVPLSTYVIGSWIGMLPGTLMYIYLGSAARSLAALLSGGLRRTPGQQAMFAPGLVATVAVTTHHDRHLRQVDGNRADGGHRQIAAGVPQTIAARDRQLVLSTTRGAREPGLAGSYCTCSRLIFILRGGPPPARHGCGWRPGSLPPSGAALAAGQTEDPRRTRWAGARPAIATRPQP
jgi:uncharacterized membrane protein YdjX (TVP38/TMEM64 family)